MKKVGIITFQDAQNYGAMLQVYALQEKVSEYNCEVKVVNYSNSKVISDYKIIKLDNSSYKNLLMSIIKNLIYFTRNIKRSLKFNKFKNKNLNLSKKYASGQDIAKDSNDYDVMIVGSDQIWNNKLTGYLDPVYFLNFDGNFKRVSYAASIGNMKIDQSLENKYSEYVNKIDSVSVRELAAKKMLQGLVKKEINVVLDPVLILDKSKWDEKISNNKINKKYIFTYEVATSDLFKEIVNYSSDTLSLPITNLKKSNIGYKNVLKNCYTNDPFEFLELIKYSEYVITTSFHATVFSIIFNKNFWVLPPVGNSDRITNLLDELGLMDRCIFSLEELRTKNLKDKIDYSIVNKKLEIYKSSSIDYLKKSLEI